MFRPLSLSAFIVVAVTAVEVVVVVVVLLVIVAAHVEKASVSLGLRGRRPHPASFCSGRYFVLASFLPQVD